MRQFTVNVWSGKPHASVSKEFDTITEAARFLVRFQDKETTSNALLFWKDSKGMERHVALQGLANELPIGGVVLPRAVIRAYTAQG